MVAIKWHNKHSHEEGYVKSVDVKEKHFINTYDRTEAHEYATEVGAKSIIGKLKAWGEGTNNEFSIVY